MNLKTNLFGVVIKIFMENSGKLFLKEKIVFVPKIDSRVNLCHEEGVRHPTTPIPKNNYLN